MQQFYVNIFFRRFHTNKGKGEAESSNINNIDWQEVIAAIELIEDQYSKSVFFVSVLHLDQTTAAGKYEDLFLHSFCLEVVSQAGRKITIPSRLCAVIVVIVLELIQTEIIFLLTILVRKPCV